METLTAIEVNKTYKSTRHGQTRVVVVEEIRKRTVKLKDAKTETVFQLPIERFQKFYQRA